ncbi:Protein of unknown function [Gryllus bimaculatus]|nr:Protein of unknown function [Gryllus bimaculatus]
MERVGGLAIVSNAVRHLAGVAMMAVSRDVEVAEERDCDVDDVFEGCELRWCRASKAIKIKKNFIIYSFTFLHFTSFSYLQLQLVQNKCFISIPLTSPSSPTQPVNIQKKTINPLKQIT